MTMIDAHIGDFDSPGFSFYNGGSIPKRQSPFLPRAREILDAILEMKRNGEYEARQLDWGSWGAKMTKQQLSDFIDSFYGKNKDPDVRKYVKELDTDKYYVLVAYETGG